MTSQTTDTLTRSERRGTGPPEVVWGLVIVWSRDEPGRIGQFATIPSGGAVLGRGGPQDGEPQRCIWLQHRPGRTRVAGPLRQKALSRTQLALKPAGGALSVRNVGRAPLRHDGFLVDAVDAAEGSVLEVDRRLAVLVVRRPDQLAGSAGVHGFGEPDAFGLVGESPAMWDVRARVDFLGPKEVPVLVHGPSGSGKELVARAVHALSPRARRAFVARNAATLPDSLIDAELFGNVADYPNAGMPARPGLVGEADGGTLFLDEIGELPLPLQTHLLRLLDHGEYQRLGDARTQRSDLRVIAATNRDPDELRVDLRARLRATVQLPGLDQRREDIPLLAAARLRALGASDPDVARFLDDAGHPRWTAAFVTRLLLHPYVAHVRELEGLLWDAMAAHPDGVLDAARHEPAEDGGTEPSELTAERVRAAMERHAGVREQVWRELGLRNRYQLRRLLKKHGLE